MKKQIRTPDSPPVPGTGKVTSNETSYLQQEEDGMSVPSNKRGGSNKYGANDKGAGESRKGEDEQVRSKPPERTSPKRLPADD